jgi:serine/threonine protein kinase
VSVQTLAGGRYGLEEVLGHGGMATVYRAYDAELERPVAIKLLAEHLATDASFRDRFVREARMAARLSHPNIVQVYDAGEDEGRPFIVMEYVEGTTLADELADRGALPAARVVDLGLHVCAGLEHAHAAGLVHRDIKPGNLLVRRDGTVKIADFGIARAAEATEMTQIGSILGTAAYLSPEQAAGDRVTAATDIYSLGAVLYELLTGKTPYTFENFAELAFKQREEPIRPLRELAPAAPESLESAVMRCLARNPEYRPASAAELAQELAIASPEPPTEALPRGTGVRATQVETVALPRPRRRDFALARFGTGLIATGVAILLAVLIAIGIAVGGDGGTTADGPAPASQSPVENVPRSDDPGEQARNLAEWLRENSR